MNIYLSLIRQRPEYRHLWMAQVVSLLGDWFNTIAAVILVTRYGDSVKAISFLFLARGLPPFLFGPLAGVIADRFNRKYILIASDILRAIIVLGLLLVNSPDRVWLVYIVTALQFMISAFFEPARAAILPSLVEGGSELLTANTLSSITWSSVLAFGAAIGGVTTDVFGVQTAIVIDAITFVISALFILKIAVINQPKDKDLPDVSGWTDLIDGFRYVRDRPRIGIFTLVKGLAQFGSVDIMYALYAERVFVVGEDGAITLGILYTFFGIGALLGPIIANLFGDSSDRFLRQGIWVGFLLLPLGWFGFSGAPFLMFAAFAIMLRGMGGSINWTYSSVMLQLKVPDKFLGRVFALDFSIFTFCYAVSVLITGLLVDALELDPRYLALWLGVASIIPMLLWTVVMRWQGQGEIHQPLVATSEGD